MAKNSDKKTAKAKGPKTLLLLGRRQATLGTTISTTNRELRGTDKVPRKDIALSTTISRNELCSLLREKLAAEAFFNDKASGLHEPLFLDKIGPISILGKFDECEVRILVGIDLALIRMPNSQLASMKFEPLAGGMSELKFTVQYHPQESDGVAELDNWLDQAVSIEIDIGKIEELQQKQPQLALNVPETAAEAIAQDTKEQETVEEQAASDRALVHGSDDAEASSSPKNKKKTPTKTKSPRPSRSKAAKAERAAGMH